MWSEKGFVPLSITLDTVCVPLPLLFNCRTEVLKVLQGGIIRAISTAFVFSVSKLSIMYLIVLPFSLTGSSLSPRSVITTLSLIDVIRLRLVSFVVQSFFLVYEAYVAIVRIQVRFTLLHIILLVRVDLHVYIY